MRRWRQVWCGVLSALVCVGCSESDSEGPAYTEERAACVAQINAYRATVGLEPLEAWTDGERCADGQSRSDAASGTAHGAFGDCEERAQNECPSWGSIEQVNTGCLEAMWNEGPPAEEPCQGACYQAHGHYINMTGSYTKVACGYHVTEDGSVWAIQNFR